MLEVKFHIKIARVSQKGCLVAGEKPIITFLVSIYTDELGKKDSVWMIRSYIKM